MKEIILPYINFILLAIFLIYLYFMNKKCHKYKQLVVHSFDTLDVYLKRRYELFVYAYDNLKYIFRNDEAFIYKIGEILRFDYSTLERKEKIELNEKIASAIKIIISEADNSEKIRNDEKYIEFKENEKELEDTIEKTRKDYNHAVKIYNEYTGTIPRCFFANAFKYGPEFLYENVYNKKKYSDEE